MESILVILRTRGIDVPDRIRESIENCADEDLLGRLLARAVTVETADELF